MTHRINAGDSKCYAHLMPELALRITVLHPPRGVTFRVQRGKSELLEPDRNDDSAIAFKFTVRIAPRERGKAPNFLGPFAQGTPSKRFVYVNSGTCAGPKNTPSTRRAKSPLTGISWSLIQKARHGIVETTIEGTGSDGGPVCATVRTEWSPADVLG